MKKVQMILASVGVFSSLMFANAQQTLEVFPEEWRKEVVSTPAIEEVVEREMGVKPMVSPLKNDSAQVHRYRPTRMITYNQMGELCKRYDWVYDEDGVGYGGNEAMVRNFRVWNPTIEEWVNSERYKVILDENGDMTEYYMDRGNIDRWENYYRFEATYDDNHNQLSANQIYWMDGEWFPMLRWENEYDANGRIVEQTYENRYSGSEWTPGLRVKWSYDEEGNELTYSQENYQNGAYVPLQLNEYTYDENGNRIRAEQSQYGKKITRIDNTFDANGNITEETVSKWRNEKWEEQSRSEITFDTENRPIAGLMTVRDSLGEWDSLERYTMMYAPTASRQEIMRYSDSLKIWQKIEQKIYQYNTNGQVLRFSRDLWNASKNTYETMVQDVYVYDGNFDLISQKTESRQEDASGNITWIPSLDFAFVYDENRNADSAIAYMKPAKSYLFLPYNNGVDQWGCPEEESWAISASYIDLQAFVHAESISLDKNRAEMLLGDSLILQESVLPAHASNAEVYWFSSNEEVARVDVDGKVFALSEGTATITVRSLDNRELTANCDITVKKDDVANSGGQVYESDFSVYSRENVIYVENEEGSGRITVADMTGRVIYNGWSRQIPVPVSGLYLVRMDGGVKKVMVR